jgi:hypothetical protein
MVVLEVGVHVCTRVCMSGYTHHTCMHLDMEICTMTKSGSLIWACTPCKVPGVCHREDNDPAAWL